MFDKIKNRLAALELAETELKCEIAKLKNDLGEMKRTLGDLLCENHFLREHVTDQFKTGQ